MKEQEVTLTEAELSDVKNSIAKLCKKYIAGSFFDKLVDSSGIKIAKDILMSDLKEMIGHGTSAPAAKKFANAVLMAKSTPAVDTILANYMLKGDGMGAGIGYSESVESTIKPFQEFLSEARKAEKIESKPSDELIAEAIKTVEAEGYKVNKIAEKSAKTESVTQDQIDEAIEVAKNHGYRVITQEQINEAKNIAEKNGYRVFTKEQIDEAKKIVESKGFRVVNESLNDFRKVTFKTTYAEPVWDEDEDEDRSFEEETNYKSVPIEMTVFARLNSNGEVEIDTEKYRRREDGSGSERLDGGFIDTDDKDGIIEMLRNGEYDDEVREALLANESKSYKGFRVVNEKDELNDIADLAREYAGEEPEPNEDVLYIKTYDYDAEEVADLINDALEDKDVPTYLRNIFKSGAKARKNYVCIDLGTYEEADEDETIDNLISLVRSYIENAVGLEAEFSDELLDNYPSLFDKAYISNI